MAMKKELEEVEVIDFEEKLPNKKRKNKANKKNAAKKEKKKKNTNKLPIIFIVLGIFVVIGGIYITKIMIDNSDKKDEKKTEEKIIKSDFDIKQELEKIINCKNYKYTNNINVYIKDSESSIYKINKEYTYNDNIYKIDKLQTIQNIEYKNTNYYVKTETEILEYVNDLTSDTYIRNNIDENKYNANIVFTNFINYLKDNYEISQEKKLTIDNNEIINVTLSANKDILNTLLVNDGSINDINKLSINNININLYFKGDTKKLYEISFKIEDKNAYQQDISNEIEYSTNTFKFDQFDNIDEISLPY